MAVETLTEPLHHIASAVAAAECPALERRRHQRSRIVASRPAVVHFDRRNAALLENLGLGGMQVRALSRWVRLGVNLRLEFQIPGLPEPMRAEGVVAWINDRREAGIQFVKLSEGRARRLREWLAKHQILNAAREFMRVADDWQARLELIAGLTRTITGASGVELVVAGNRALGCTVPDGLLVRSTIAAQIEDNERMIGHLEICSIEFGAFDEADLRMVSTLAAVLSEMVRLSVATPEESPRKPPLATRIANRMEGMLPTIRVRVVF